MMIKKVIPKELKLFVQKNKRGIIDLREGHTFKFAKKKAVPETLSYNINKTQIIKNNADFEARIYNLNKASELVESVQINPNEIFSFWKAIGNPSKKRGFKKGISIINGELSESIGGGLCQLSGLIYFISLEANLEIVERYNHSLDLYTDETRYTPLGSDATVVYGYKDLRIKNNFDFPIKFSFHITKNEICVSLLSAKEITKKEVQFKDHKESTNEKEVTTYIDNLNKTTSKYKKMAILNH